MISEEKKQLVAGSADIPTTPEGPKIEREQETICKRCGNPYGAEKHGWVMATHNGQPDGKPILEPGVTPGLARIKYIPCPVCSPAALPNLARQKRQRELDAAFNGSNIPEEYRGWTFDSFPTTTQTASAKAAMLRFARGMRGQNSAYLNGSWGLGKTGLAVAAAHYWMEQGKTVLYMRSADYFERVKNQKYNKRLLSNQDVDIIGLSYYVDAFLLDDFGVGKPTVEVATNFYNFVEERRSNPNLLTVITSNIPVKALSRACYIQGEDEFNQPFQRVAQRIEEKFYNIELQGNAQRNVR